MKCIICNETAYSKQQGFPLCPNHSLTLSHYYNAKAIMEGCEKQLKDLLDKLS